MQYLASYEKVKVAKPARNWKVPPGDRPHSYLAFTVRTSLLRNLAFACGHFIFSQRLLLE